MARMWKTELSFIDSSNTKLYSHSENSLAALSKLTMVLQYHRNDMPLSVYPYDLKFTSMQSLTQMFIATLFKTARTCCLVTKSHQTLLQPLDCSPPGSTVEAVLQARWLEWVVISFSRGSSQPRDTAWSSALAGRFFATEPPGKPQLGSILGALPKDKLWYFHTMEYYSIKTNGQKDMEQT